MRWVGLLFLIACGATPRSAPPAQPSASSSFEDSWRTLSYGVYLAPRETNDRVDVIFHFHAGKAAETDYRSAGVSAAVVAVTLSGLGTTPYWDFMNDPGKFDAMKDELARSLSKRAGRDVRIGRVALVGWSAGYASIQRIVAVDRYYREIDAVILLDGPHTGWAPTAGGASGGLPPALGKRRANIQTIAPFVRFMRDAQSGKKLFVMTHSSIVPLDYASTTEVADALAIDLGAAWTSDARPGPEGAYRAADAGDAHLRGFHGDQARDHVRQVHFVRDVIGAWLGPRWSK